jgi:hypothetical protein
MALQTISVTVDVKSQSDKKNMEDTLTKLASLPYEDRSRISQIINNNKALKALENKWTILKMMF